MCAGHRNGTRQGIVKYSFLLIIFKKKKETRESDILTLRYYITNNKPRQIQSPSPPPKKRVTHTHRQDRKKGIRHLMLKIASRLRSSNMLSAERERQLKWTWAALYSRDIIRLRIEKNPRLTSTVVDKDHLFEKAIRKKEQHFTGTTRYMKQQSDQLLNVFISSV